MSPCRVWSSPSPLEPVSQLRAARITLVRACRYSGILGGGSLRARSCARRRWGGPRAVDARRYDDCLGATFGIILVGAWLVVYNSGLFRRASLEIRPPNFGKDEAVVTRRFAFGRSDHGGSVTSGSAASRYCRSRHHCAGRHDRSSRPHANFINGELGAGDRCSWAMVFPNARADCRATSSQNLRALPKGHALRVLAVARAARRAQNGRAPSTGAFMIIYGIRRGFGILSQNRM